MYLRTNNPLCLGNYLQKRHIVKSYLDSHLYCNPGLWLSLPHKQLLHVLLLAGSPSWKSEFHHHMSRCKIPTQSILPIGSPLEENHFISMCKSPDNLPKFAFEMQKSVYISAYQMQQIFHCWRMHLMHLRTTYPLCLKIYLKNKEI